MGQSGTIRLFSSVEKTDLHQIVNAVIAIFRSQLVLTIRQWRHADKEWKAVQQGREPPYETQVVAERLSGAALVDLAKFHRSHSVLIIDELLGSPWQPRIVQSMREDVPANLRGDFEFCRLILYFGRHDLVEYDEQTGSPKYYGLAHFSLAIFGYGLPMDFEAYRSYIPRMHALSELKAELEEVVGPLHYCAHWST